MFAGLFLRILSFHPPGGIVLNTREHSQRIKPRLSCKSKVLIILRYPGISPHEAHSDLLPFSYRVAVVPEVASQKPYNLFSQPGILPGRHLPQSVPSGAEERYVNSIFHRFLFDFGQSIAPAQGFVSSRPVRGQKPTDSFHQLRMFSHLIL